MVKHVIVIGGGLAGMSAVHTAVQGGCNVTLVDKEAFLGGNSTKATSGINGAGTNSQGVKNVPDSPQQFYEDTVRSATGIKKGDLPENAWYELGKVLTYESADAVHWIQSKFGLALDATSRLGGHSFPRTHRSAEGKVFPGMEITYTLIEAFEKLCKENPSKYAIINRARVNKLLQDSNGRVNGVQYNQKGQNKTVTGSAVIIATGGYGAGCLEAGSLLQKVRKDLFDKTLPTTNGKHCTGDGIQIALDIGAGAVGLDDVQVHPTGLFNPKHPKERTLFLAAGALRGEGGILIDRDGNRFCNDLGTRDYVTGKMWEHAKAPYRLVLNSKCASNIAWHCAHYTGRGVMKKFEHGNDVCKEMGIAPSALKATFDKYNQFHKNDSDPWGKPASFYRGTPWTLNDSFYVAQVTPVVHYTMGGLHIDKKANVLKKADASPIAGLYAAGEVAGGVHGRNRLGGSALLECVVFGRKAGSSAVEYVQGVADAPAASTGSAVIISIPQADGSTITVQINGTGVVAGGAPSTAAPAVEPAAPVQETKQYTMKEVSAHNTENDCWVVVNGKVLDVTEFMNDHPGGKMAIMTFAGKDSTEEFNMVHDKNVVDKYASDCIVGTLKPTSKL
jgi:flavocytochrome c